MVETFKSGGNSPQLSPLLESRDEDDYSTSRKRVKKKERAVELAEERTDKNNRGFGVCLTHSDKKDRRSDRRGRRTREDANGTHRRNSSERNKHKTKEPVSKPLSQESLSRISSANEVVEDQPNAAAAAGVVDGLGLRPGVCLTLLKSDRSTKGRRSDRRGHPPDATPQRKKRKQKEPVSETFSTRSLPRKSSAVKDKEVLPNGPRRKLTFSSSDNADGGVRRYFC